VSPPSLKNRRNSEGPGGARRDSRVLSDFWSGFPGRLGPFEFSESRPPATDSKAEIFDMPTAAATPRPSCGDIDGGKLHEQDTDGQAGRLADKWGLLLCLLLLLDVLGARAVATS
jgi:hypothetical protein